MKNNHGRTGLGEGDGWDEITGQMQFKVCNSCKQPLPSSDLYKRSGRRNGLSSQCKKCLEGYRRFDSASKSKRTEWKKRWPKNNPDKAKQAERRKVARSKERIRVYDRSYRASHADQKYQMVMRWMRNHPEKRCEYNNRRRALKVRVSGTFTSNEFIELKKKYGNKCLACGRPEEGKKRLVADHIIPLGHEGSTNWITNIQPLCRPCNTRKSNKFIDYRPKE